MCHHGFRGLFLLAEIKSLKHTRTEFFPHLARKTLHWKILQVKPLVFFFAGIMPYPCKECTFCHPSRYCLNFYYDAWKHVG